MRLIDADLEIERICTICKKYGNNTLNKEMFSANDIMEILKNSPTAYNIEKVVEQLEEKRKAYYEDYNLYKCERDLGNVDGLKNAIEIVKRGGAE